MEQGQYTQAVMLGKVLTRVVSTRVEPFSGNALYYPRRTGTMEQYKTVKEVCALTGLTGKHLYYFHHENVVRAAAYANYSVEGNDGYKLYDEAGVEKLQQIALLYELGLKRNEIRDLMLSSKYSFDAVLEELYYRKNEEAERIRRQLAAMDYLKKIGIQNGLAGILRRCSLEELGREMLEQNTDSFALDISKIHQFEEECGKILLKISHLPENERETYREAEMIRELFALGQDCFGENGKPLLLGLLLSVSGGGELGKTMREAMPPELAIEILNCIDKFPQVQIADIDPIIGI